LGDDGVRYLEGKKIWSGYLAHWSGKKVCARRLPQKDYETGRSILILWPDEPAPEPPFVALYFNERLVKYPLSFLGHLAVLVNGKVFNFSHWMNENEAMSPEEYFSGRRWVNSLRTRRADATIREIPKGLTTTNSAGFSCGRFMC